jgi:hypothetical protein
MKKTRLTITEEELFYLKHIMDHFTDYMAHDDRPDHGLGILKGYRDLNEEEKNIIYSLAGKLIRAYHKLINRNYDSRRNIL